MIYTGRFAPSPTGPLHLGTLAAAALSFIHARQAAGRWLLRIEDIDPPREVPGAADAIMRTLSALELAWDGEVRFQSQRLEVYFAAAEALFREGAAFYCGCSRQQLRAQSGALRYPGTCRDRGLGPRDAALRLRVGDGPVGFRDGLRGERTGDVAAGEGDFVILRRDGLPAYHLAVVVDDADQGVTDVVRGADLLACTPQHVLLQRALGLPSPRYWHVPLITNRAGDKLSKGTGAPAVDAQDPAAVVWRILTLLGLRPPRALQGAAPSELWDYAIAQFRFAELAERPEAIPEEPG